MGKEKYFKNECEVIASLVVVTTCTCTWKYMCIALALGKLKEKKGDVTYPTIAQTN